MLAPHNSNLQQTAQPHKHMHHLVLHAPGRETGSGSCWEAETEDGDGGAGGMRASAGQGHGRPAYGGVQNWCTTCCSSAAAASCTVAVPAPPPPPLQRSALPLPLLPPLASAGAPAIGRRTGDEMDRRKASEWDEIRRRK